MLLSLGNLTKVGTLTEPWREISNISKVNPAGGMFVGAGIEFTGRDVAGAGRDLAGGI
jgi:hypothetical protein